MYVVYRAHGANTNLSYYGYCFCETDADISKTFFQGVNRTDENRAEKLLIEENGGDTAIKFQVIDSFTDEVSAWSCRNDQRASNIDSITSPTLWPIHLSTSAEPQSLAEWKLAAKRNEAETARQAWKLGKWTIQEVQSLTKKHKREVIMSDLDTLSPFEFNKKYFINV